MLEFETANSLIGDGLGLQARASRDGYLFFRGLVDTDALLALRAEICRLMADTGWLKPGTDPLLAAAGEGAAHIEGQSEYMGVYNRLQRLESFHAFAHQPALLSVLASLFGEPPLVHARNIARMVFPQAVEHTTPAHQDYLYIEGTENTWTAWIPLGDCPVHQGSLAVLPGTHVHGMYPVYRSLGAGGHRIDTDAECPQIAWHGSDFKAGDVLLFHSLTVHKALPNLTEDTIRLSLDYRYQPLSEPVVEGSLLPHYGQQTWEQIYAEWSSEQYQYYWKHAELNIVNNRSELRQKLVVK